MTFRPSRLSRPGRSAPDGDLSAAFALIDTLDVMRAPVHAIATAEVGGAAVGVYAAAQRRLAFPHARFRLAEPKLTGGARPWGSRAGTGLRDRKTVASLSPVGRPAHRGRELAA